MLEKKQKGKPIAAAKKPAASNVFDLMGALRASLEKTGKSAPASKPQKKAAKRRAG